MASRHGAGGPWQVPLVSSRGAAASVKLGLKFGLGAKRVKVLRRLVAATATVGGGLTGKRLYCLPAAR